MQYINETEKFWKHSYRVHLSEHDVDGLLINADNEQDALDYAIDYAESQGWEGLFLDDNDIQELENEGFLDEHLSGGNHGRYLSSFNIRIELLD
jgi:hypothetical protein